jgi:hypothetical protein
MVAIMNLQRFYKEKHPSPPKSEGNYKKIAIGLKTTNKG